MEGNLWTPGILNSQILDKSFLSPDFDWLYDAQSHDYFASMLSADLLTDHPSFSHVVIRGIKDTLMQVKALRNVTPEMKLKVEMAYGCDHRGTKLGSPLCRFCSSDESSIENAKCRWIYERIFISHGWMQ